MKKVFCVSLFLAVIILCCTTTVPAYVIKGFEGEVDAVDARIDGRDYVLLTDFCKAHGITWEWDNISRKILLKKNGREIVFLVGSKYYYDGKRVKKLSAPLRMKSGSVWIPRKFVKYSAKSVFGLHALPSGRKISKTISAERRSGIEKAAKKFKIRKVVIDAGHGGKDPGATSRHGLHEKNIILDVSKRIRKELEKKGVGVIMTRDSDKFVSLGGRTKIANKNNADLFVSIHANANRRRWVSGFEVYYLSEATDDNARALAAAENSVLKYEKESLGRRTKDRDAIVWDLTFSENRKEAIELAGFICQGVAKKARLRKNNIRSARFYVLKGAEMPAVLVELSYLSNRTDEKNLKKSSYRQKLAEGIVEGIMDFKSEYDRTNGFSR